MGKNRIGAVLVMLLVFCVPVTTTAKAGQNMPVDTLYTWVFAELGIPATYPLPDIRMVSKADMKHLLKKFAVNFLRKDSSIGITVKPQERMQPYPKNALGLFVPKTGIIFIRKSLSPCRRNAVIAHELTHYLQVATCGRLRATTPYAREIHILREMEASDIEMKYIKVFCANKHVPVF